MLVSGEHRKRNQQQPRQPQPAPALRQSRPIKAPHNQREHNMQRGRLIIRLVKRRQRSKQPARQPRRFRLRPTELQRPHHKTHHRNGLRQQQLRRIAAQFRAGAAQKKAQRIEKIQRPIRHNRPRPKRNLPLPGKRDFRHRRAHSGEPVGQAVGAVENHAHQQQMPQRFIKARPAAIVNCRYV